MADENKNQNPSGSPQDNKEIEELKKFIANAEKNLESAKKALSELGGEDISEYKSAKPSKSLKELKTTEGGKVIEGIFNGENMVGPEGKAYPVPANYASKSKMIEGDKLKLTVAEDGSFIFKQIGPVERKNLVGSLVFEDNNYQVQAEGKKYNILFASVTYFKAKPGDRVTIVVPADGKSDWAALENIIHDVPEENKISEDMQAKETVDVTMLDMDKAQPQPEAPKEQAEAPAEVTPPAPLGNIEVPTSDLSPISPADNLPEADIFKVPDAITPPPVEPVVEPEIAVESTPTIPVQGGTNTELPTTEAPVTDILKDSFENNTLPEESFLPQTPTDTTNSLGERTPGSLPEPNETPATELEI